MANYTFKAPDGEIWASEHEYRVFDALRQLGAPVRRCVPGAVDTFSYLEAKAGVQCVACGSTECVQARVYTPDLFVAEVQPGGATQPTEPPQAGYYLEAKGYFRADKRRLFRHFRKGKPDLDIRLVVQRAHRVGKGTILTWARRYAKVEVHRWDWKRDDITDVVPPNWMTWEKR